MAHHSLGFASKRVLTKLENATPPSWPRPSLMTQFNVAARGIAPAPRPMAKS